MTDHTKHTVHTDALDTLGHLISDQEERDAVHLAVFPIEAGHYLTPGEHVYIADDGRAYSCSDDDGWDNAVGIADPFLDLDEGVSEGDWFWLMVYPRQITSLHHVWEHPSFPTTKVEGKAQGVPPHRQSDAEQWLLDFIAEKDLPFGLDAIAEAVKNGSWSGHGDDYGSITVDDESFIFYGSDAYGEIPPEFWTMMEDYLNVTIDGTTRPQYFNCTC